MAARRAALSWEQLGAHVTKSGLLGRDSVNGPTNAQSRLRLFGGPEESVRVTLYRDNHAWCPYCQKVWLWLEEKKVPYRIEKVTMFCYGEKEAWYKSLKTKFKITVSLFQILNQAREFMFLRFSDF